MKTALKIGVLLLAGGMAGVALADNPPPITAKVVPQEQQQQQDRDHQDHKQSRDEHKNDHNKAANNAPSYNKQGHETSKEQHKPKPVTARVEHKPTKAQGRVVRHIRDDIYEVRADGRLMQVRIPTRVMASHRLRPNDEIIIQGNDFVNSILIVTNLLMPPR
ncbi:hypothetical protein QCD60_14660 [Pokkaliibacter sp. MBI-7]|uniref:hypothetical protein n=1 Tax=Pokkaliibacter sp. MBI-7 TaxID=3040600 RepID=UPI0024490AC3|nr:hypothetical protein [Pokkaliibacter sp. MBI-7]MDH2433812.1 hypothetical protein [Pokkaliibacter sp. MBI-7]